MKLLSRISRQMAGFSLPHNSRMTIALAALLFDVLLDELPNALHPVAWLGRWARALETRLRTHAPATPAGELVAGVLALCGLLGATWMPASFLRRLSQPWRTLVEIVALEQAMAARALDQAVGDVEAALRAHDLPRARHLLGWHLVSRDTTTLTTEEVAMATIESLAENLNDSVIAPLVWYLLGGLPAAWGYRAANTADAMWGYRTPRYEWFGKPAARLDDLLNLLPARLTALLIVVASGSWQQAWHTWRREASRTPSPNAGHPMAAMAGALQTTLSKRDVYALRGGDAPCTPAHIRRARHIAWRVGALSAMVLASVALVQTNVHTWWRRRKDGRETALHDVCVRKPPALHANQQG